MSLSKVRLVPTHSLAESNSCVCVCAPRGLILTWQRLKGLRATNSTADELQVDPHHRASHARERQGNSPHISHVRVGLYQHPTEGGTI